MRSYILSSLFVLLGTLSQACSTTTNGVAMLALSQPCSALQDGRLSTAETWCETRVKAISPQNDTGVFVSRGEHYTIVAAPPNQTWHDNSRGNHPPCGEPGSLLMNIWSPLKRASDSKWFSLIAEVDEEKYDLCKCGEIEVQAAGRLVLYANDAWGWYWNNSGEVVVKITRW